MTTTDAIGSRHRLVSRGVIQVMSFDPTCEAMPNTRTTYRASGGLEFVFVPVRLPSGHYRAYIVRQPDYGPRSASASAVHRLLDQHGYYICWEPEPTSADALLKVMRVWSECTVTYLATGVFAPPRGS